MRKLGNFLAAACAACSFGAAAQDAVVESARALPVAADVDVVVVGGTAAGVAAATAARAAGASVFLAGGYPYLGEDVAGTLELGLPDGEKPSAALVKKLWASTSDVAHYSYVTSAQPPQWANWAHRNDAQDRFAEPGRPPSPQDTVCYDTNVTITCTLDEPTKVKSVEVLMMRTLWRKGTTGDLFAGRTYEPSAADAIDDATDRIVCRVTKGSLAGKSFYLERGGTFRVEGGHVHGNCDAEVTCWTCPVVGEISAAEIYIEKNPKTKAKGQQLSRIWFHRSDAASFMAPPTPLKVKRLFDAELVGAGVKFLTGSPACGLLRDAKGALAGVVVANRSGRQAIRAKCVIDASPYSVASRFASPVPGVGGEATFSRIVVAGEKPSNPSLKVEELPREFRIPSVKYGRDAKGNLVSYPTEHKAKAYRCTLALPMADGSYRSFAAAEMEARERTWTPSTMDSANVLALRSAFAPAAKREWLWTVSCAAPLQQRVKAGEAAGREAAAAAKGRAALAGVRVESPSADGAKNLGEVREPLGGIRPYDRTLARETVPSPACALPILGEYDVVVIGGGTSGAPAGLGAAESGAKTLVVEYMHVLGGVGTEGMVLGYYDGNHCGFTKEFNAAIRKQDARYGYFRRWECYRRAYRKAGAEIWLGAMGEGAYVKDGKVIGAVVVTPQGRGVVLAKCVIDGTGDSDVAAAAGAETTFISAREIALQSAGQAPRRLGRGGINSDFGYVNDPDAWDTWLFGLRARAGAPEAWDISGLADSRERRRIVPDLLYAVHDVVAHRAFPDVMMQSWSRVDSHGYLRDEFCFVSEPQENPDKSEAGKRTSMRHSANVPLRSLLPKGLSGVAVVGLGLGVERDVLPVVRMQADLQNLGYAAGMAAAMAAKGADGEFRKIDVAALRGKLIEKKILRPEAANWTADEPLHCTDAELAAAVEAMADRFRQSHLVMREGKRSLPFLREAYKKAATPEAKQIYAEMLGLLGDATGADTLVEIVSGKTKLIRVRKGNCYGGEGMDRIGYPLALGRTKNPRALKPLLKLLAGANPTTSVQTMRAATLALEALGDPGAAEALAKKLDEPGVSGWARKRFEELPPLGGYGLGPEMDRCLGELAYARALLACGDWQGRGRAVYEAYARDPRGILAEHAAAVLAKYPGGKVEK